MNDRPDKNWPKPDLADLLALGGLASAGAGAGTVWGLGWGLLVGGGMAFALGVLITWRSTARRTA